MPVSPQGYQQPHGYQQPFGTGEIPVTKYAWIMAAMVFIEIIIAVPAYAITGDEDSVSSILGTIIMVLKIFLLFKDSKEIKRCGYKISKGWYILGYFIGGPYLYHRAKKVDQNFKPFYLWMLSLIIVTVLTFVVLSIFG